MLLGYAVIYSTMMTSNEKSGVILKITEQCKYGRHAPDILSLILLIIAKMTVPTVILSFIAAIVALFCFWHGFANTLSCKRN